MAVSAYIYGLRGWIAFVAFMEVGTAMRCFFDMDFLKLRLYINSSLNDYSLLQRLFGMWSIFNFMILSHCALCIHHLPIYVMSICSLSLSVFMYISEAFIYEMMCYHSYSFLIPVCVKGITIILLGVAPQFLWIPGRDFDESDEEEHLLKLLPNKKKWNKKRTNDFGPFILTRRKIAWPAIDDRNLLVSS